MTDRKVDTTSCPGGLNDGGPSFFLFLPIESLLRADILLKLSERENLAKSYKKYIDFKASLTTPLTFIIPHGSCTF